jgi:hypothetical protein
MNVVVVKIREIDELIADLEAVMVSLPIEEHRTIFIDRVKKMIGRVVKEGVEK